MATGLRNPKPTRQERAARWQAIRERLDLHSAELASRGTVASRLAGRHRVWSVRFRSLTQDGQPRYRAIYLGHDAWLVRQARRYLARLRRLQATQEAARAPTAAALASQARRARRLSGTLLAGLRLALGRPSLA